VNARAEHLYLTFILRNKFFILGITAETAAANLSSVIG
jgi:hypothetical protein